MHFRKVPTLTIRQRCRRSTERLWEIDEGGESFSRRLFFGKGLTPTVHRRPTVFASTRDAGRHHLQNHVQPHAVYERVVTTRETAEICRPLEEETD